MKNVFPWKPKLLDLSFWKCVQTMFPEHPIVMCFTRVNFGRDIRAFGNATSCIIHTSVLEIVILNFRICVLWRNSPNHTDICLEASQKMRIVHFSQNYRPFHHAYTDPLSRVYYSSDEKHPFSCALLCPLLTQEREWCFNSLDLQETFHQYHPKPTKCSTPLVKRLQWLLECLEAASTC